MACHLFALVLIEVVIQAANEAKNGIIRDTLLEEKTFIIKWLLVERKCSLKCQLNFFTDNLTLLIIS